MLILTGKPLGRPLTAVTWHLSNNVIRSAPRSFFLVKKGGKSQACVVAVDDGLARGSKLIRHEEYVRPVCLSVRSL